MVTFFGFIGHGLSMNGIRNNMRHKCVIINSYFKFLPLNSNLETVKWIWVNVQHVPLEIWLLDPVVAVEIVVWPDDEAIPAELVMSRRGQRGPSRRRPLHVPTSAIIVITTQYTVLVIDFILYPAQLVLVGASASDHQTVASPRGTCRHIRCIVVVTHVVRGDGIVDVVVVAVVGR